MDALPPSDRITGPERVRSALHRLWSRAKCAVGRHDWAQRRNPDVGGPNAVYHQCRRCGTEYVPPDPRQTWM